MNDRRLSFSPCSIVSKLDEERLCLCPPMKLLTNSLLNSSNELTEFGGILLNQTHARPLRVVGKALHIISSGTPWRCIVVLKVAMWLNGSRVPSYESREGILNFGGRGWPLMEAVKGESVLWTKSSIGFALLIFSFISSMTLFIWSISSFKCGIVREVVPCNWLPISTFSLPSWLCVCPPPSYSSRAYLLRLISLLNSWFCRVNSAIVAAMDCTCWADGVCVAGADWGPWWGLLEAFLLPWWPGLVALDLVRTINLLSQKRKLRENLFPTDSANWWFLWKSVGWWVSNVRGCKI